MIIDTRIRPPYKGFAGGSNYSKDKPAKWAAMFGGKVAESVKHAPERFEKGEHDVILKECLAEMDEAGIDFAFVPGRKGQDKVWIDNQDVVDLCNEYPDRFAGIASICHEDPMEYNLDQIKKFCIDGPLYGVSIETGLVSDIPSATPRFVDDPLFWPIYDLCEKNNVIVSFTHNGPAYPDTSGSDPVRLKNIYSDFPNLKTLLVHGSWPHVNEIAAYLFVNKNVMVQPDFYMMHAAGWQGYVDSINYMNPENYVFSSSYPLADMKTMVEYYLNCGIKEEILPNLFYKNAARFFGIDPEKVKRLPNSPVKDEFESV